MVKEFLFFIPLIAILNLFLAFRLAWNNMVGDGSDAWLVFVGYYVMSSLVFQLLGTTVSIMLIAKIKLKLSQFFTLFIGIISLGLTIFLVGYITIMIMSHNRFY